MVVGTIGDAVPVEVLAGADADVVPILGVPGDPTPLADRFIEPMVGGRARSQLQRVLDGSYEALDLLVVSRERDALLRIFYALREIRRIEPSRGLPPVHVFDVQPVPSPAAAAWNCDRVRGLCTLLGVGDNALRDGIRRANDERRAAHDARDTANDRRRVYVAGSEHGDTGLGKAIDAAGGVVVDAPPILADEHADPVEAIARRYAHPLAAGARASSVERARLTVEAARAADAEVVVAFYLEGDDGLRWELPELLAALETADVPAVVLDRQPYDLEGLTVDV